MSQKYDVIVIGGGPAGMMAAGRAAELGARVLLLEKNASLGKKLLITGGGRSNITNAEFNVHVFLEKFQASAKFLFSAFARFGVEDTFSFFHRLGMQTKVEAEKRAFPLSDKAASVLQALEKYMSEGGVKIETKAGVDGFEKEGNQISAVVLKSGERVKAASYVLATGGKSRPETGSTGDGFRFLRDLGHTVIEPDPSLVPITIRETLVRDLAGLSFQSVKVSVLQNEKVQLRKRGKVLFTHVGLSGPLILNMSKDIREMLKYGHVVILLDFFSTLDSGALDRKLQAFLRPEQNKMIKNVLGGFVAPSLVPVILKLSHIDGEKFVRVLSREERLRVVRTLKDFRLTVKGLLGVEKAIVTSGGVDLREVDFTTLRSRKISNLYLVGDILNIDRPSGGYSLQLCWTTGQVAGEAAARAARE